MEWKIMLFVMIFGILSTGHWDSMTLVECLDKKSSSSTFTINVWDSGNGTEIANSTSSIVRGKMEISSSTISTATTPISIQQVQPTYLTNTSRSTSQSTSSSYSNVHHSNSNNNNNNSNNNNKESKLPQSRNKPLLNALVNKLESLSTKLDRLGLVQVEIQKSFDNLESRYSLSSGVDDVPQCGRRVDRVLRTLTPLVSRVEGLWNVVAGVGSGKLAGANLNVSPSQFLGAPPNDILLSESRRQERAITAIRSDLNVRSRQIISELGTVEHQLDLLQNNLNKIPSSSSSPSSTDPVDLLPGDLQLNNNDVTLTAEGLPNNVIGNGTLLRVPGLVFPSVRNKPSSDISTIDGAEALLTGSGQTGVSCAELMHQGSRRSGLFHLRLPGARSSFWQLLAYCEQETAGGGWMVIQRRADFGEPRESFHRNWVEYRSGFGDPVRELWMGNLNLHLLTTSEDQILRIELEDFDGEKRYAEYSTFKVASEADGFRLEVSGYTGDAGDALSDPWYGAHGSAFSTHDRDNDRSSLNCASMLKGGWWWKSCGRGLNGLYYDAPQPDSALARQGIVWFRWKGWDYTLKRATMMIRPKTYRPINSTTTI